MLANILFTLKFLINVLDQISILLGNFVEMNKHTGPNKHTGAKLLAQDIISYECRPCAKLQNH